MGFEGKAKYYIASACMICVALVILFKAFPAPLISDNPQISYNSSQSSSAETQEESGKLINLNTCTYDELLSLKGIGPAKAEAILAYRSETGGFKSTEELMNISGIGEQTYEAIRAKITV